MRFVLRIADFSFFRAHFGWVYACQSDEIGASLSHLAIQSDLARQLLARGELAPERLEAMSAGARQTLDHMRDVVWLLVPNTSNCGELSHRLQAIASRLLDGVRHDIVVEGEPPEWKPAIEWSRNVVTFLKEALTNARRPAGHR